MSGPSSPRPWINRAWQALLVVVAVALGARLVYALLGPLLPGLLVVVVLVGLLLFLLNRRNRW